MTISWFCQWDCIGDRAGEGKPALDSYDRQGLVALLRGCRGLIEGHVFSPASAHDPHYAADLGGSPVLVLQLEFSEIADLERCLQANGYLSCLADPHFLPSLNGAAASHQAMLTRRYPVAEPQPVAAPEGPLSYLVEYAGPAADEQAWHRFYVGKHPHLLAKFPGIRKIEIYTPAVVISDLPFSLRTSMQRNKTVFDSAEAMNAAMLSPVRDALRQDFHSFPAFEGEAAHYPFHTLSVAGTA
ncbi:MULTISPECIES: hypothetical protein [unclassified Beijerinckia]|uniref:hypothetical protein n=1 Tax=unclassified Beijerinckia TaxID=2638183 RepID=UPI000898F146|nr:MULTISPECIES: hypothetical protein [unclassified Beijerinckia]MDH7799541.1 hypothetical protein [Beijerinckia sp. GAS462]SEB46309.1 hypothetical protein SAMN05443249_0032 [Beijerinckia sp. 28-YEA-48]